MPLELQIIRASEFIRLGPENHFDLKESRKELVLLAKACRKRGIGQALLDLRRLLVPEKPLFNATQLAALVDTFREAGFTDDQRLAVLYKTDPHHGARMFAFISAMRGCQVRAFQDFEEAVHWLSEIKEKTEPRPGVAVQIASARTEAKIKVTKEWKRERAS